MVLEIRMDKESSRGIGMRLLAPRLNNRNLIFFGSPVPALASAKAAAGKSTLERALQWDALAFLPHSTDTCWLQTITHTHIYKDMHSPPHPRSLASVALNRQPDKRVCDQRREWLQDRMAACRSWITSPVAKSCVYGVCAFVCWGVFSCSHTVLPKEHSLGVIFFLLTFLMLCCIFLQFPVFLSCLPPCHICMLCMDRLMAHFTSNYTLYNLLCHK